MLNFLLPKIAYAESTFVEITTTDISTMLGYVKSLITDLTPLLLPIIAIGLGLIIMYAIISAIR